MNRLQIRAPVEEWEVATTTIVIRDETSSLIFPQKSEFIVSELGQEDAREGEGDMDTWRGLGMVQYLVYTPVLGPARVATTQDLATIAFPTSSPPPHCCLRSSPDMSMPTKDVNNKATSPT